MGDTDLIHGLTFDVAFDAMQGDSVELADWIKDDLLPVVEEVLDQYRGKGLRRRIARLEIDLGTVSAVQARSELPRRLFGQLSDALEELLDQANRGDEAGDRAPGQGSDMLEFLRSGTMPWAAAWDANAAHTKLLQQLIYSPQAHAVLSAALGEAHMLTRLIRQFDTPQLLAAAEVLLSTWTEAERAAALAWAAGELRRHQDAGGEAESFWRWFLPQRAHPASPAALQARWNQSCHGELAAAPQAKISAIASFSARAACAIEQGLESADAALLAPYWDRILASAPQYLRNAHPRLWQRWLEKFDADTLADIVCVTQADCAWLIACLATVVPRRQLNALLRPAMQQWLAEPLDSLAPHLVLDWVTALVPEQSERIRALFAGPSARARFRHSQQALETKPIVDNASLSQLEMNIIEHGLETADFILLAPYWDRILSSAPQCLRAAHPRCWERWLRDFDDDTLIDIAGIVQANCATLIERFAASVPPGRRNVQLRPALQQWLSAPVDTLAPHRVLGWPEASAPGQAAAQLPPIAQEQDFPKLAEAPEPDQPGGTRSLIAEDKAPQGREPVARASGARNVQAAAQLPPIAQEQDFPKLAEAPEPDQPGGIRSLIAEDTAPQGREPVARTSGAWNVQSDAQLLSTARVLFRPWPQEQRDAVLAWAGEQLRRLRETGSDSVAFWRWFLPQSAHPVSLSALAQQWPANDDALPQRVTVVDGGGHGLPPGDESLAYEQLCATLREPQGSVRLAWQLNAGQRWTAARVLFTPWPHTQCEAVLAWAAQEQQRLHDAGGGVESFWCWFLSQHVHPAPLDALVQRYTAGFKPDAAGTAPAELAALFTPDEISAIKHGLAHAQFPLLAPHWDRLLTGSPQCIRAEHPQRWRTWMASFHDDVLMDILLVVQPDCKPMFDDMTAVMPRERLLPLMRPALPAWLGAAPQRLSPRAMLMHVMKSAPQHADALSALIQAPDASLAAGAQHAAVDSRHFREPLQVLDPIFARSEIITISKCLNAGQFALLAPYWDRLLVLAPHWLRSEYPRLARTWLAGFDDDVLIDILSVVQADCCTLIERLASALPREQLHAALRPSLARWFGAGLDQLAPRSIMDEVLRAAPGMPAELQAMLGAPVNDTYPVRLEEALQRGEVAQLLAIWPSIMMLQRAQLRRIWAQLPSEKRDHAIACLTAGLGLAQQVDVALILQPAVAMLMAELQPLLAGRPDSGAILGTALQFLLHAGVASVVPKQLMQRVLDQHSSLRTELALGETRHIAAALQACSGRPVQEQDLALASAHLSEQALRGYLADCQREDAQFGKLNAAQLLGLVQAWAGFQQAGERSGAFLSAIEDRALCSASPHAVFGKVLQQAMLDERIDLDEIGADCGAMAPAPLTLARSIDEVAAPRFGLDTSATLAHSGTSPLSEMQCQALPRRLADAMLHADLSALDTFWPSIVMYHPDLLRQAAQRYLGRAEARNRLIGRAEAGKMQDLLACLSAWAAQLVAPLIDGAARFSATAPTALAPAAFEQRVLRFAFAQVMDHPVLSEPAEWISGLLHAVLPASSPQSESGNALTAHAWYELLRAEDTPLKAALKDVLFGNAYLEVTRRRLRPGEFAGRKTSLPEVLQHALTIELCDSHAALTDQLFVSGSLVDAEANAFSAAEWHALARAQLPRQQRADQLVFWREYSARLPAPAANRAACEEEVQAAFAAAFGVLKKPVIHSAGAAGKLAAPPHAVQLAASADNIAILLMREGAPPDGPARASITLLTQRLLDDANGCTDSTVHATLHSALSHQRVIGRLLDVAPGPTFARLLCVLRPALAGALPAVLRRIGDTFQIPLSSVPAMLDRNIWRAIYEAVFTGAVPTDARAFAGALAERLASQQGQEGSAWMQQLDMQSFSTEPGAAATPDDAMALLLQPLAGTQADKAAARKQHVDAESAPFTGAANLRNAGLVLVAPYIERLFSLLGITKDGVFVSEDTRQRGVHLLQYVITAQESTPEYLLALNKLLCGVPAAVPLVAGISMTDKEKDTIDQMLKGVIAHWSAIGSSSVTGLRETFLQREGCLYYQEEAWHLKVPQRTFDMLLDRLPWGYKLIKFSWMPAPLNVAWR